MEELLQRLLEAEVLTEDTKKELQEAFDKQIEEAKAAAKEEAAADVRAELTEQWIEERDALIEAIDAKVGEYLQSELDELREDIDRFRDLEAEYAEQLVEAKSQMSDQLKSDLNDLVEKLDKFLEMRLSAEIEELQEDIEEQRKNLFGRRVFEAFAQEFMEEYADQDSAESNLREMQERLQDVEKQLEESERKRSQLERQQKLEEVLQPLSGRQREVMEAILKNVDTEHLEEGYRTFIGRVLREAPDANSEKEEPVLAEDDTSGNDKKLRENVTYASGDHEDDVIEESESSQSNSDRQARLAELKKIAGIDNQ